MLRRSSNLIPALAIVKVRSATIASATPLLTSSSSFFSSDSLKAPPGVSSQELMSNIKSSHQATSNLRMAEMQRQQEAEHMAQQTLKYRDGLMSDTRHAHAHAGGLSPTTRGIGMMNQQQQGGNNDTNTNNNTSSSSMLHYSVPTNPLTIGRDQLVLSMWQSILAGRRAIFLTGPDGVGSSTVASLFSEHARRSGRFSCIHWFDCSRTKSNVNPDVAASSIQRSPIEQLREFVSTMRERKEDEVLLVFDQPEEPTEILKALHSTFVAMKEAEGNNNDGGKTSDDNNSAGEEGSEAAAKKKDPASPAEYMFSGPPKLGTNESRSHYSRLHLVFVTPQKIDTVHKKIINPLDELLQVSVSTSHHQQSPSSSSSVSLTLASEFSPAVVNVDPVDEVPAMLLSERLIQNSLSEYYPHQLELEKQGGGKTDKNTTTAAEPEFTPLPPPSLHDPHLQIICQACANVPLLVQLASYYTAAQLMTSDRVKELAQKGEMMVGEEEHALFRRIIQTQLVEDIIMEKSVKNKTDENPDGSLSVSAAAAELCLATVETIVAKTSPSRHLTVRFVQQIIFTLASLNVARLSSSLVEAVTVEIAKSFDEKNISKFIGESSKNRESLVNDVIMILRRSGFLSDSLVLREEEGLSIKKSLNVVDFDKTTGNTTNAFSSGSINEEVFSCHVCLADGLLNKLISSSSSSASSVDSSIYRTLLNLFIKANARHDINATLAISRHVQALTNNYKSLLSSSSNTGTANISDNNNNNNNAIIKTRIDLFDRVANFLVGSASKNQVTSSDNIAVAKKLWRTAFEEACCSSSNKDNNNNNNSELAEIGAKIGLDLGRVLLGDFEYRSSRKQFATQQDADNELNSIISLLEWASSLTPVSSKNTTWAEIISLRARMMDPEDASTLSTLAEAAQILENEVENPSSASSASTTTTTNQQQTQQEQYQEMMRMKQEYFILLVAWAKTSEIQGKEIPEKHWQKMNAVNASLSSSSSKKKN